MKNFATSKPSICFVSMPIYHLLENPDSSRFCGGAELQQLLIGRELASRGYDVSYVTFDHGQGPEVRLEQFRVLGACKPRAGLPVLGFYYPRWGAIMNALGRSDADIYYMRGASFLLAPIVLHARKAGKQVLFAGASNTDFDPKAKSFRLFRDRILYWWGLRRVHAVVAQNQEQAAQAQEMLGQRAAIIHNGLSEIPGSLSSGEDVLWVGNIRPKKSPERFVDLAASFPGERFVMVGGIVGKKRYPSGPVSSTGTKASELENFEYTGYLPPDKVATYYGRAKILVNTSDVEGFPNTFLHAWSWGVPVITFVDPDSIVAKNRLGWVVSSPEEMKRVLADVLSGKLHLSPERIADHYRKEFMTSRQVDRYEEVLSSLVSKRS